MATRVMTPAPGPVCGTVRPPGSRSLTNRALVVAALAKGKSRIEAAGLSDDTLALAEALGTLGIKVAVEEEARRMRIAGCAGQVPDGPKDLYAGDSGTATRFLTA
ncbi:MAG: 3-phosphoshikimate 1-carboxyvinyltransferase, partial [Phycisphaerae bacterium]